MSTNRTCGDCTACCTVLMIAEPLFKAAGVDCQHLIQIGDHTRRGCGIYDSRPPVCRDFRCAWLMNDEPDMPSHMKTKDDERPDQCGVLVGPAARESRFYKETGIPLLLAYETRPGGREGYHAERLIKRLARRTLVAIVSFDSLNKDPRSFVGPAHLVRAAKEFAIRVSGPRAR